VRHRVVGLSERANEPRRRDKETARQKGNQDPEKRRHHPLQTPKPRVGTFGSKGHASEGLAFPFLSKQKGGRARFGNPQREREVPFSAQTKFQSHPRNIVYSVGRSNNSKNEVGRSSTRQLRSCSLWCLVLCSAYAHARSAFRSRSLLCSRLWSYLGAYSAGCVRRGELVVVSAPVWLCSCSCFGGCRRLDRVKSEKPGR
jgi:hypothetical protein